MVNGFKKHINENSFYTLQSEKDDFINNDKAIMNAFMFSFIGIISMINVSKPVSVQKIKTYFKQDQQLRTASISDSNNDASLIIKIMSDKDFFKTPAVVNQMTRFLVIMKQGTIDNVDESVIRGWIDAIKVDKLMLLPPPVKKRLKTFQDGGSLIVLAADLKEFAVYRNGNKMKDTEYFKLAKIVKYDMKIINTAKAADKAVKSTVPTASTSTTSPDPVVAKVAATVDPVKKPVKIKIEKFNLDGVFSDIAINGKSDLDDRWKINNSNRNEMLTSLLDNYVERRPSWSESDWKTTLEYLQKYPINQTVLEKALLGPMSGYRFVYDAAARLIVFAASGIFSLFTKDKSSKSIAQAFEIVIKKIVADGANKESILELDTHKKSVESFLQTPIVKQHSEIRMNYGHTLTERLVYAYIFFPGTGKAILRRNALINIQPDGSFTYDFEKQPDILSMAILKYYDVQPLERGDKLLKELQSYTFKWDKFTTDEIALISESLDVLFKQDINAYDKIAISLLRRYINSGPPNARWLEITNKLASNMSMKTLIASMVDNYTRNVVLESLPNPTVRIMLSRIQEYIQSNPDVLESLPDGIGLNRKMLNFLNELREAAKKVSYSNSKFDTFIAENYTKFIIGAYKIRGFFRNPYEETVPNDANKLQQLLTKKQQDNIDTAAMTDMSDGIVKGPTSIYSDMSPENKKMAAALLEEKSIIRLKHIADQALLNTIPPEKYIEDHGFVLTLAKFDFDTAEYANRMLSTPEAKEKLDILFVNSNSYSVEENIILKLLTKVDSINDVKFAGYIATILEKNRSTHILSKLITSIRSDEGALNKREKIILEKVMDYVDKNVKKLTKDYKEFMTSAQATFMNYIETDKDSAEAAFLKMSDNMKRRIAAGYLSNKDFASNVRNALEGQSSLIKPYEKLTDKRLTEMLKYNNVSSEETKIAAKHLKSFATLDKFAVDNKDIKPLQDLQVIQNESTPKEMAQLTSTMYRTKRSNNHGNEGLVFKRSFDVAIPIQTKSHAEWLDKFPTQEIINPMFHGAGAIAASMILRYGFRVIKSGDGSVAGRMLGDGIYGAINIDKSAQYVGDARFSRRVGTKGYIFEMKAALGEKNKDYKVMGLGSDGIKSPEWCVFTPNSQFLILKAYEVEIVSQTTMKDILSENPAQVKVNENGSLIRFKSYLREYTMKDITDVSENYTTFTFVNGLIPMSSKLGDYVELEDFKSPDPERIIMEASPYGPSIVVRGTEEQNNYLLTSPTDLIENHPDAFAEYIRYFNGIYA
jgi:hypothetical protein